MLVITNITITIIAVINSLLIQTIDGKTISYNFNNE